MPVSACKRNDNPGSFRPLKTPSFPVSGDRSPRPPRRRAALVATALLTARNTSIARWTTSSRIVRND